MLFRESTIQNQESLSFHIKEWLPDTPAIGFIFLLHGLSDHSGRFKHLGESFAKEGFVFFAPDLRGNGRSGGKRGHFNSSEQVLNDISFIFDEASKKYPGIPSFIYGQSMGGNLALSYCLRRKPSISGVISSSPWLRLVKTPNAFTRIMGSLVGFLLPALSVSNGINADDLTHDTIISKAYRNDPLIHGRITLNTFKIITGSGEWCLRNATHLKIPLLLLHGTADRITSFDASQEFSKACTNRQTFISKQGLFHELHNEPSKQEVIAEIIDWTKTIVNDENQSIPNQ
jgi:alpha-beta hydrolase superfamily lysophospholipase